MRRSLVHLALAGTLALAGCGTTVSTTGLGASQQQGLGDGLGPTTGPVAPGTTSGPTATTTPDTSPSSTTTEPGTTLPPSAVSGGARPGAQGRGVTSTTVAVGLPVPTGTSGAADAFGVKGAGGSSPQRMAQAVIDDINRTGGVLRRKLMPSFYGFDTTQAVTNPDATAAAICTNYRDDHKVFAIVFSTPHPALRRCAAAMGSPLLIETGVSSLISSSAYDEAGGSYLYGINAITAQRLAELFIESLEARGFHEKWNTAVGGPGGVAAPKLGVIHIDTPDQNLLYASYAKELAKRGRAFAETVVYSQNVTQALAATQSAVLRFKAAGVTHVYGASAFFLQAAESQGYRPRYAYLPGLGQLGAANSPSAQLKGAMTVGWAPAIDVAGAQDPGMSSAAKHCLAVMVKAGLSTENRNDVYGMLNTCDALYSLRDALSAGGEPTVPGLRRGFESLGTGFVPALTFQATMGPHRHYGVDAVRDMAYDTGCRCLVYTSKRNRT